MPHRISLRNDKQKLFTQIMGLSDANMVAKERKNTATLCTL